GRMATVKEIGADIVELPWLSVARAVMETRPSGKGVDRSNRLGTPVAVAIPSEFVPSLNSTLAIEPSASVACAVRTMLVPNSTYTSCCGEITETVGAEGRGSLT